LPSSVWSSDFKPEGIVDSSRLGDETAHNFRFYARSRKPANGKLRTTASWRERKNFVGENPNFNARKFRYYLSRAHYQREWGIRLIRLPRLEVPVGMR